jgi:DNA-binding PadR family transcriptional regulator
MVRRERSHSSLPNAWAVKLSRSNDEERELFVLGLLRRQPFSAYSISQAMRGHVPLYRGFKRGNLYNFVEKLATAGLLEHEDAAARRGPRGTKTVYRLSAAGEVRFRELLRQVLMDEQAADPALETALVLLGQLARDEAVGLLMERAEEVVKHERRLSRLLGDVKKRGGAAYIGQSHTVHRLRSERRFLAETIALLQDPKWQPDWVLDDGPVVDAARKL